MGVLGGLLNHPKERKPIYYPASVRLCCAEALLAEAETSGSLLDLHLFQSLTGFQLFVACREIPTVCNDFRVQFLNSVRGTLIKAQGEGKTAGREYVYRGFCVDGYLLGIDVCPEIVFETAWLLAGFQEKRRFDSDSSNVTC